MDDKEIRSIADPNIPNAGRIYDYWLGGHHNFEVDRQMGDQVLEMVPFMAKTSRLIRWFLSEAVRVVSGRGFKNFIDFASGLPTKDHIHLIAPEGTKVIYSDIDPITVEYGIEIIGENPNVKYVRCDAAQPEDLLNSEVVSNLFGETRRVAFGMNGVAYFLTDEQLSYSLKALYNWADEGSVLFISDANADLSNMTESLLQLVELYKNIGQPIFPRQQDHFLELMKPWKVSEPGPMPLDAWLGVGEDIKEKEVAQWGGHGFFGVILEK